MPVDTVVVCLSIDAHIHRREESGLTALRDRSARVIKSATDR